MYSLHSSTAKWSKAKFTALGAFIFLRYVTFRVTISFTNWPHYIVSSTPVLSPLSGWTFPRIPKCLPVSSSLPKSFKISPIMFCLGRRHTCKVWTTSYIKRFRVSLHSSATLPYVFRIVNHTLELKDHLETYSIEFWRGTRRVARNPIWRDRYHFTATLLHGPCRQNRERPAE